MNELSTQERQLPDTLEELSRFVLIGREKLNSVRAEIRAIEKVQLAAEVHEQKLQEAQEIAEAVLDAETKLGELTSEMEKSVGGRPSKTINTAVNSKKSQLEEIGLSQMQASRFETLANHPEAVEQAKADARAEGKIVTRQDVFNEINAENENRRQAEARKLREAKERRKEFESYLEECAAEDAGNVVSFNSIKQNNDDRERIFDNFRDEFSKMISHVRRFAIMAENGELEKVVKMTSSLNQITLSNNLQECYRSLLKIQRVVAEVMDEE